MLLYFNFSDDGPGGGGSVQAEVNLREYVNTPTDQQIRDLADYIADNVTFGVGNLETTAIWTPEQRSITPNP